MGNRSMCTCVYVWAHSDSHVYIGAHAGFQHLERPTRESTDEGKVKIWMRKCRLNR